jgi:hypothetical protein
MDALAKDMCWEQEGFDLAASGGIQMNVGTGMFFQRFSSSLDGPRRPFGRGKSPSPHKIE